MFDEGHHSVAESWTVLKKKFPIAIIINYSATPLRADGRLMAGKFIYSFPIFRAINEGYVKSLKAVVLNPRTLKYSHTEGGEEVELSLQEVRELGATNSDFRKSTMTSTESRNTIIDASIRELYKLREETGENKLKIIAAAMNYGECQRIVEAYRARNLNADYIHTKQNSTVNKQILKRLEITNLM